jgi:hypothetical protein
MEPGKTWLSSNHGVFASPRLKGAEAGLLPAEQGAIWRMSRPGVPRPYRGQGAKNGRPKRPGLWGWDIGTPLNRKETATAGRFGLQGIRLFPAGSNNPQRPALSRRHPASASIPSKEVAKPSVRGRCSGESLESFCFMLP